MNLQKYFWWLFSFSVLGFLVLMIFPGKIVLEQSFGIGGFQIYYYGLVVALAVFVAWRYLRRNLNQINISASQLENLLIVILVCGFIGARIYHVVFGLNFYSQNPTQIFMVWNGGLAIFGAVIGGLSGLYFYNRFYLKLSLLKLLDYLVPALVIGQIIGRFGNLFNYELYGLPTNLPWKMFVPEFARIAPYFDFSYFHPLFLYESLASLLILLVLLRYNDLAQRLGLPDKAGNRFYLWLILYGILRFGIEILRIDSNYIWGVKQNFLVSIIVIAIGLYFWLFNRNNESTSSQNN